MAFRAKCGWLAQHQIKRASREISECMGLPYLDIGHRFERQEAESSSIRSDTVTIDLGIVQAAAYVTGASDTVVYGGVPQRRHTDHEVMHLYHMNNNSSISATKEHSLSVLRWMEQNQSIAPSGLFFESTNQRIKASIAMETIAYSYNNLQHGLDGGKIDDPSQSYSFNYVPGALVDNVVEMAFDDPEKLCLLSEMEGQDPLPALEPFYGRLDHANVLGAWAGERHFFDLSAKPAISIAFDGHRFTITSQYRRLSPQDATFKFRYMFWMDANALANDALECKKRENEAIREALLGEYRDDLIAALEFGPPGGNFEELKVRAAEI